MANFTTAYNYKYSSDGFFGWLGMGPVPATGFRLTCTTTSSPDNYHGVLFAPRYGSTWRAMIYDPNDWSKYATYNLAGGTIYRESNEIAIAASITGRAGAPASFSTDIHLYSNYWDFHGGLTSADLPGLALCLYSPETYGDFPDWAPGDFDAIALKGTSSVCNQLDMFTYTLIDPEPEPPEPEPPEPDPDPSTRLIQMIGEDKIYAERALRDNSGNLIEHEYAHIADLAEVAFSGSYDDLSNKPTIPVLPAMKELVGGNNITITEGTNDVTVACTVTVGTVTV